MKAQKIIFLAGVTAMFCACNTKPVGYFCVSGKISDADVKNLRFLISFVAEIHPSEKRRIQHFPKPAFYGMPYPFVKDLQGNDKFLRPDKAFFKPEKQEFFFTLEDALNYPNPEKMVIDFCRSGFYLVQELSRCKNIDWITRPLDYPEK